MSISQIGDRWELGMLRKRWAGVVLIATVGWSAVACIAPGIGAEPPAAPAITKVDFTPQERAEALGYWTPQRMKQLGVDLDLGPTGPIAQNWSGVQMKTIGRLFFVHGDNGKDSYCTATSVHSDNRDVVLTAAHCVQKGSAPAFPYTTMVFVPGYDNGKVPYGVFPVRSFLMPTSFVNESKNDVAALVVDPVDGKHVNDVVGAQRVAVGRKPGKQVVSFGYPASNPQLGEQLMHCAGKSAVDHTVTDPSNPHQLVRCDMTGGSSGGPWLADLNTNTGQGIVVSVNSSLGVPDTMAGSVFGDEVQQLLLEASRS
ncbi:trypsin-like serine peptidase [Lentzea sp. NPDC051213]|uniref:trypsin-like serine peptidase n=1 Tax=Lentzea sp. NPDC051213 TaxID=3364126 RepID=UPI00379616B3